MCFFIQYLAESASLTPNNDEIKRIMGDHAALAANYKNVPPLARGNPGPSAAMGVPQPSLSRN